MKTSILALTAAVSILGGSVLAQNEPVPDALTWTVLSRLNEFYDDPNDPMNRPEVIHQVPAGVITAVNVNDDGKPDWLIRYPEEGWFCGTGGCATSLFVSGPEGYSRALDRQVLDLKLLPQAGVEAWVHHIYCNDDPMDCRVAWRWDEASRQLVPVPSSDGRGLLSGGGVAPVDGGDNGQSVADPAWPSAIEQAWRESRQVCLDDSDPGYIVNHATVLPTPDLDGDGRVDWIVLQPGTCGAGFEGRPQVWATRGDDAAMVFEGEAGQGLRLDVAASPARVLVTSACAEDETCEYRPLVWSAAAGRLAL